MKEDKTYQLLLGKMHEVSLIPPQSVGPLTNLYKIAVPYLKFAPWKSLAVISSILVLSFYLLLGSSLIKLASLLQFGF